MTRSDAAAAAATTVTVTRTTTRRRCAATKMPPNLGRFAERLTCLSHAELVVLAARGSSPTSSPAARPTASSPAADAAVDRGRVATCSRSSSCASTRAKTAPRRASAAVGARVGCGTRRVLRWIELPEFAWLCEAPGEPGCLTTLTDGRLAVSNEIETEDGHVGMLHIIGSDYRKQATFGVEEKVDAMVAGDAGLYVSTDGHDGYASAYTTTTPYDRCR